MAELKGVRSMPEVPEQMQQNLAKLELDTRYMSPALSTRAVDPRNGQNYAHQTMSPSPQNQYPPQAAFSQPVPRQQPRVSPRVSPNPGSQGFQSMPPQPSEQFFPHIKNLPPNVPTRAEVTEQILESARQAVLTSNDAEMQVTWAQDTLTYIDSAIENNARMAEAGMGRSRTPDIERQLRIDALSIISFLADQHHPRAEFIRGTWLEFGKFGYEIDKPQAFRSFSTAARNGYARSEYRIGMQFEETNELDKALKHYSIGVQAHDAASCYVSDWKSILFYSC